MTGKPAKVDVKAQNSAGVSKRTVGRPFQKGVSGNPGGKPKRGGSWSDIFRTLGEMDGEQASVFASGQLAQQLRAMPKGVPLKTLVALRVYVALYNEPGGGSLLGHVMDRVDGPIKALVDVTTDGRAMGAIAFNYDGLIPRAEARPTGDSLPSGESEDSVQRPEVGQVNDGRLPKP